MISKHGWRDSLVIRLCVCKCGGDCVVEGRGVVWSVGPFTLGPDWVLWLVISIKGVLGRG